MSMIDAADIEAIERATLAALSPRNMEERDGWLLPFEPGTIGRAKSAVPLRHDRADPAIVPVIEERYAAQALAPRFRLAEEASLAPLHSALRLRGYRAEQPTRVEIAAAAAAASPSGDAAVALSAVADEAWASVYLGPGFDPVDGACRVRAFRRARDAVFAQLRIADETVAVGTAAFAFGWASVHGMRTALAYRRRGLARCVLGALARAALDRGIDRIVLQVEEANSAALALYAGAGFRPAWRYRYWLAED
jgi:ribosomal protein S18 acetylase RimI-like enzyme